MYRIVSLLTFHILFDDSSRELSGRIRTTTFTLSSLFVIGLLWFCLPVFVAVVLLFRMVGLIGDLIGDRILNYIYCNR